MGQLHVGNVDIEIDVEGFLCHAEDWNEDVAEALAAQEGIDHLGREQRDIIMFMRAYHRKFDNFPIMRYVCKNVHASTADCVTEQFCNPMVAWKIAGLPKPPNVFFNSFDGKKYFPNPFY
ncbi:TusE/DsrC/DsvC family sulfur relay protein [Desulfosediminicola ganghwensis]|uniref:TusE/DsrC/DsvC family sulfur relay protein n=1 Tax=Desulfosediminicola ganghwensis TaxID=2569540 RepID=UPI0010AB5937|nr:TusE/DsrC/DsvC family sulfur relay protein [Desulfosediminicola ganghwensis]